MPLKHVKAMFDFTAWSVAFHHSVLLWCDLYVFCNIGKAIVYKLLENILHGLFLEIINETDTDIHQNISPTFWGKTHYI